MQKRLSAKQAQLEKAKIKLGEESRVAAEARYKEFCENGGPSFKKEDMEAAGAKAVTARIKELEDEHRVRAPKKWSLDHSQNLVLWTGLVEGAECRRRGPASKLEG